MSSSTTSPGAGICFKPDYLDDVMACTSRDFWTEVHTENYLVDGGIRLEMLERVRSRFPVSFHGVSASLGGVDTPNKQFMRSVRDLVDRFDPVFVSEHAVWSKFEGNYFPDLLPLPRTSEALSQLAAGVSAYQEGIGRTILLENPTNYLNFASDMDEPEFLIEVAQQTGCGLLLDINNLYLSSVNSGIDCHKYIDSIPHGLVGEVHIAGYTPDDNFGNDLLIDSHAEPVAEPVWQLLNYALDRLGPLPVLLERDDNLPNWEDLLAEKNRTQRLLSTHGGLDVVSVT